MEIPINETPAKTQARNVRNSQKLCDSARFCSSNGTLCIIMHGVVTTIQLLVSLSLCLIFCLAI